jgi:DNA-binding NarL/FixJ family response regulator
MPYSRRIGLRRIIDSLWRVTEAVGAFGVNSNCGQILVVDDDPAFRDLIATLLERIGCQTVGAGDGHEALHTAASSPPDVVLLDVDLPGSSGYEICRELRDAYGDDLPIVFISGTRTEQLDRVGGLLIGADDYVVKPFEPDELLARVRRLLARASIRPAARAAEELTSREQEILRLLAAGLDQAAIASLLVISPKTVATHIQRILGKLGVRSRAQAVAFAHQHGLVGAIS